LFSGGALIVGGAARTDLIAPEMTEPLTRDLHRTLQHAFESLPDETLLYPTHGGGSFCSTGAGGERVSTLAAERRQNPLLAIADEEEFVEWFPATFPAAPSYFFRMRAFNRQGPRLVREVPPPPALTPAEFDHERSRSLIVDARDKEQYAAGHIPGVLSIPFRGDYALWLGWLAPPETPLLFVVDGVSLSDVVDQTLLVGLESFAGWLDGGMEAWSAAGLPTATTGLVDAREARQALLVGALVLDVREPSEFEAGHIEDAVHVPLGQLAAMADALPKDRPVLAYCGHGERASTAVSLLERSGFDRILNLDGGIGAWKDAN
jgi:rhodanese-related sulfurtransferase